MEEENIGLCTALCRALRQRFWTVQKGFQYLPGYTLKPFRGSAGDQTSKTLRHCLSGRGLLPQVHPQPRILNMLLLPLSLSVMFSLGVLSAGCNLIVKRGDPVRFVTMALTYYFSGRIFPVQILPASLQSVAWVLPQTWIYYLWRKSLFANASPLEILNGLLFLTVTLVVLASIAYGVFQYGINKIREEGLIE